MRMITKGRFAVAAMLDVALRAAHGPVSLASISLRQNISASYLDQLFGKLRKRGLVESCRGPGGGYWLARDAASISVAEIVAAVDEDEGEAVSRSTIGPASDAAHEVWRRLDGQITGFLDSISLKTLVDQHLASGRGIDNLPLRRAISLAPVVQRVRTNAPNSVFALADALTRNWKAS